MPYCSLDDGVIEMIKQGVRDANKRQAERTRRVDGLTNIDWLNGPGVDDLPVTMVDKRKPFDAMAYMLEERPGVTDEMVRQFQEDVTMRMQVLKPPTTRPC